MQGQDRLHASGLLIRNTASEGEIVRLDTSCFVKFRLTDGARSSVLTDNSQTE